MKIRFLVLSLLAAWTLSGCTAGRAADCADPRSSHEAAQCLEQSAAAPTGIRANPAPPQQRASYEFFSRTGRQTGPWYFELTIEPFPYRTAIPSNVVAIWVGCRRPHWHGGATARIIPAATYLAVHIGIALDLNAGKMYIRVADGWLNDGEPGSSAGLDVKLGQLYRCGVESAIPLQSLMDDRTLDVNYGEHDFYYSIPDGYRPFVDGGT